MKNIRHSDDDFGFAKIMSLEKEWAFRCFWLKKILVAKKKRGHSFRDLD